MNVGDATTDIRHITRHVPQSPPRLRRSGSLARSARSRRKCHNRCLN